MCRRLQGRAQNHSSAGVPGVGVCRRQGWGVPGSGQVRGERGTQPHGRARSDRLKALWRFHLQPSQAQVSSWSLEDTLHSGWGGFTPLPEPSLLLGKGSAPRGNKKGGKRTNAWERPAIEQGLNTQELFIQSACCQTRGEPGGFGLTGTGARLQSTHPDSRAHGRPTLELWDLP